MKAIIVCDIPKKKHIPLIQKEFIFKYLNGHDVKVDTIFIPHNIAILYLPEYPDYERGWNDCVSWLIGQGTSNQRNNDNG